MMTSQSIQQTNQPTELATVDLQAWAPALTEETENFPNYWQLKGWRCVVEASDA